MHFFKRQSVAESQHDGIGVAEEIEHRKEHHEQIKEETSNMAQCGAQLRSEKSAHAFSPLAGKRSEAFGRFPGHVMANPIPSFVGPGKVPAGECQLGRTGSFQGLANEHRSQEQ
jgi:hypothetical protein